MGIFDTYYCPNLECWYAKAQSNKGYCPECGTKLEKVGFKDSIKLINNKGKLNKVPDKKVTNKDEEPKEDKLHPKIKGLRYGRRTYLTIKEEGLEIKTKGALIGGGEKSETVRYGDITGFQKGKYTLDGRTLDIITSGKKRKITNLNEENYTEFTELVDSKIANAKNIKPTETKQDTDSPMQKIKEAKELLDMGALSQEEFDELKQKYIKQL